MEIRVIDYLNSKHFKAHFEPYKKRPFILSQNLHSMKIEYGGRSTLWDIFQVRVQSGNKNNVILPDVFNNKIMFVVVVAVVVVVLLRWKLAFHALIFSALDLEDYVYVCL